MNFAHIPAGTSLFIDANVFVYDFGPDPQLGPACRTLLERVETGELTASISANVMHDVAHRLMTLEACTTFGWPYAGIALRLRRHPTDVQKLFRFRQALDVRVVPVEADQVIHAADVSRAHGLLSGDALIVAVMQRSGIQALASNDDDFDRVPGITRYIPL